MSKIYQIDGWNNFCRIFELPEKFSDDYCFGGGIATNFQMVDWFNPVVELDRPAVSKEIWEKEVGEIKVISITIEDLENQLKDFILGKGYIKPNRQYLFLSNFGASFIMES